jgi:tetratricopeptide (TPR) repeat protein
VVVTLALSIGIGLAGCSSAAPVITPTPQVTPAHVADAATQARIDAAKSALKANKFDDALREAQAATAADPQSSEAQWVLGNTYNQMADTQTTTELRQSYLTRAVDAYLQAIKLDPNYDSAYTNLATVYYKTGQYDEAQKRVEQALKINPSDATSHYILGTIYIQRNSTESSDVLDKAQAEFEEAVKDDPNLGAAYIGLANVYLIKNDPAKALQNAQKGVELTQNAPDPYVYWALAQAQSATGDKAGCMKTIEKINSFNVADDSFNQQLQKLTQQCK